ncbi:hypothetical protein DA803_01565 [[Mycoplasma] phocae]|uniref:Uncharacterized protein n=1 Tax=[Mycoplasma] phocae TaxID=142651 RepID=A0A2Z5IPU8_9BACT|nr:hypothetical protein [[Mycoplasma] phocae]AXE60773.1 hypothetical protein DA803_01565 [[Mycoplasma] phocae]
MKDIKKKRRIKMDYGHLNYLIATWVSLFFALIALLAASLYGIKLSPVSLILISITQVLVTFSTVYIAVCFFPLRRIFNEKLPKRIKKYQLISIFVILSLAIFFIVNAFLAKPIWSNYFSSSNDLEQQKIALSYINLLKTEMIVLMSVYSIIVLINGIMFTSYFTRAKYWESE